MLETFPRLFTDELGVWREDKPSHPFGIKWDEITAVGGYKLDGITKVYALVELSDGSGHWIELNVEWSGFVQVSDAITAKLPGIRPSWFEDINALDVGAPALTIWRRA